MNLRSDAVLELDRDDAPGGTGAFTLQNVEFPHQLERQMLIGNRGQVISGIADIAPLAPDLLSDGAGVDIDVGQGNDTPTVEFEVVPNSTGSNFQWGDGSGNSRYDQPNGHEQDMAELLQEYCRVSKTGSQNPARLHWGPFSDGTYGDAGLFGEPFPCIVVSVTTKPSQKDDPSALTGSITLRRTSSYGGVDISLPDF